MNPDRACYYEFEDIGKPRVLQLVKGGSYYRCYDESKNALYDNPVPVMLNLDDGLYCSGVFMKRILMLLPLFGFQPVVSAERASLSDLSGLPLSGPGIGGRFSSSTKDLSVRYDSPGNALELGFCSFLSSSFLSRVINCIKAKSAANDAVSRAAGKCPGSTLIGGKGDAFRHCYWSARMTIDMGEAKGFGDRHEAFSHAPERYMDLKNNEIGRSVGAVYRSYESASRRCEFLAHTDQLVTRA
ncbi:DUF6973 domain-containing protein [Tropheryma whipplei]|uniref:DUF6973 domain-containing protein n=1 Tax=Tropheryma whipplei TaxID=2039 RepID=UPI0004B3CD5F|nr:hypothetical protein [Tropheryma whipplei]